MKSGRASLRNLPSEPTSKRGRSPARCFRRLLTTQTPMRRESLRSWIRSQVLGSGRKRASPRQLVARERRSTSWLPEWHRSSSPRKRGGMCRRRPLCSICRQTFGAGSPALCASWKPFRLPARSCMAGGRRLGLSLDLGLGCSCSIAMRSRPIGFLSLRRTTHDRRPQQHQAVPENLVPDSTELRRTPWTDSLHRARFGLIDGFRLDS